MNFLAKHSERSCCRNERKTVGPLPFDSLLYHDFYDGPLEGLTTCNICQQGYYFKAIFSDEWYCRIFQFSRLDFTHYEIANRIGVNVNAGEFIATPSDYERTRKQNEFLEMQSEKPTTNICASHAYFKFGIWIPAPENFARIDDWYIYLNITIDDDNRGFRCD